MSAESTQRADGRQDRTRTALIAILVMLVLLLAGLTYFVTTLVVPAGAPRIATTPAGLEWVRSIYGYGPKYVDQFQGPTDAAVAPDGTIWGTDPQRGRLLAFNPDGSFKLMIETGTPGEGARKLYRPLTLDVDDQGDVYVCEYGNQRIMVFDPQGQFLREWPVPAPTEIVVKGGRVYVASVSGIATFTLKGELLSIWGTRGRAAEQFNSPHGLAVADDGTVYVCDTLNVRLKAYRPDGTLLWIWPKDRANAAPTGIRPRAGATPVQVPSGLVIDGRGRLVLVDPFEFEIIVLQPSTTGATLVGRYGSQGEQDGLFTYPSSLGYDAARDWFVVADTGNDRLQVVRIPGSASNAALAAVRRSTTGASWLCGVPFLLLLAAVAIWVLRRRARRGTEAAEGGPDSGDEAWGDGL